MEWETRFEKLLFVQNAERSLLSKSCSLFALEKENFLCANFTFAFYFQSKALACTDPSLLQSPEKSRRAKALELVTNTCRRSHRSRRSPFIFIF
jgi:hypothetical protein